MLTQISSTDLARACCLLFAHDIPCPASFIKHLKPDALKTAFRKKALETHPDRAKALGVRENVQSRRFADVKKAYDVLLPLAGKTLSFSIGRPRQESAAQYPHSSFYRSYQHPGQKKRAPFHRGPLPSRALRFGQYLYYSGIISWNQLIKAIFWQKRVTRRYGNIALDWGMMNHQQICYVLMYRKRREVFGEFARKCGFINDFQHLAIMGKQRKTHRLFGEFFLCQEILTPHELETHLSQMKSHNLRFI